MPDENHYTRAIHESDQVEQLRAFYQFTLAEHEATHQRLTQLEADDSSIPDEDQDQWNYEKGRLDALRLYTGMFAQALMTNGVSNPEAVTDDP